MDSPNSVKQLILECPYVKLFKNNGCSEFNSSDDDSVATHFDNSEIRHEIEIYRPTSMWNYDKYRVSVRFIFGGFSWVIMDIPYHRADFISMFEQLDGRNEITTKVRGGGNSHWVFGHINLTKSYYLSIHLSTIDCEPEIGGQSGFVIYVPREQGEECIRIMKKIYDTMDSEGSACSSSSSST